MISGHVVAEGDTSSVGAAILARAGLGTADLAALIATCVRIERACLHDRLFIGLEARTSLSKAAMFDTSGRQLAAAPRSTTTHRPQEG